MGVTVKDNGYMSFLRFIHQEPSHESVRQDPSVKVGIFDENAAAMHGDSSLQNGEIAYIHEFGEGRIPERSWLRSWVDNNIRLIQRTLADRLRDAYKNGKEGTVANIALGELGAWAKEQLFWHILNNIPPPLSPLTIKRKGHNLALVDTHQMIDSIDYKVGR